MCTHKSENKIRWTELKRQLLTARKVNSRMKASSPVWNAQTPNSATQITGSLRPWPTSPEARFNSASEKSTNYHPFH